MDDIIVTSSDNKILKLIKSIGAGKEKDKFIIEGENFVKDISKKTEIYAYVVSESKAHLTFDETKRKVVVTDHLLAQVLKTVNPQGVLAICYKKEVRLPGITLPDKNPFVLVLDKIQDPGNMGTLIRSAKAFGVDYILTLKGTVDIYNDKVIRSSAGGILDIPIVEGLSYEQVIEHLKEKKINLVCTSPHAELFHYEINLRQPIGIVLGNESQGIAQELITNSDFCVKIPMTHMESLNVSVAGGILMHEVLKNRG